MRPIGDFVGYTQSVERNTDVLKTLYQVEKQIGAAADLDGVLVALADAALVLVPRATHVTIVLSDELGTEPVGSDEAGYVPVLTRVRSADGTSLAPVEPVPITRSVFRKVVRERAAVLAADAPTESFSSNRCWARASAAPSACRSGRAMTFSASSRSTTATRPPCSTRLTSTRWACSPRPLRWLSPTRG